MRGRPSNSSKVATALPADTPQPPESLAGEARREWDRICGELHKLNRLHVGIRPVLVAYCAAYMVHESGLAAINERGVVYETESGLLKQNPAVGMIRDAATTMRQYLCEMGLTPVSSQRVKGTKTKAADEFADYLKR